MTTFRKLPTIKPSNTARITNSAGEVTSAAARLTVAVPGVFGTGLNDKGELLAAGETDPHYTITTSPDSEFPGPTAAVEKGQEAPYPLPTAMPEPERLLGRRPAPARPIPCGPLARRLLWKRRASPPRPAAPELPEVHPDRSPNG